MKKQLLILLILQFAFVMGNSQNVGQNYFIALNKANACYIKAIKVKDVWDITLSNFTADNVKDTTFTDVVLNADSILNAILIQTKGELVVKYTTDTAKKDSDTTKKAINIVKITPKFVKGDTISKSTNYTSNILQVRKTLEEIQISYTKNVLAGELKIHKTVTVEKITETTLHRKDWDKLKYVSPFFSKISTDKKPIKKRWNKAYYIDSVLSVQINTKSKPQETTKNNSKKETDCIVSKSPPQIDNVPFNIYDSTHYLVYRKRQLFSDSTRRKRKLHIKITEPNKTIEIKRANFFIKDGFIDNISIEAIDRTVEKTKSNDSLLQFTNAFPIPISSKKNIRKLNNTYLYANVPNGIVYKLNIGEAFKYVFEVEKDQYDLSPSDTLLQINFTENKNVEILNLEKEDKNKLFEYKVFSDFVGIDEAKPNGLVQIEAQRKIKLYTKYVIQRFPIGAMQYIEPSFKWNKIENQNSYLIPSSKADTFTVDSVTQSGTTKAQYNVVRKRTVTALDLFQYQQMSAGFNLNLISGFNGNTKLKYTIDGLFNFGRTKIRDSISTVDTSYVPYRVVNTTQAPSETKVNTLQWGLALKIQFFPEARYGFTIGSRYVNMYLADLDFTQQNKSYGNALEKDKYLNRGIWGSEIQVHKNFDKDGKFYVRYVFNSQINNLKYNFSQFQIGINKYLKF